MPGSSPAGDATSLSPARSRTDPPAPERSHLHKRLQSTSLRHRALAGFPRDHHHLRFNARETVQSAIELKPPISFDTLLRRDKRAPDSSQRGSSHHLPKQASDTIDWSAQHATKSVRENVRPQELEKAKEHNAKRGEALRGALKLVEEGAMQNTGQLDETFYSILEKASTLRATVMGLKQLVQEARSMRDQFQQEAVELHDETQKGLDSLHDFDAQESRIQELVEQLRSSQTVCERFNARLEAARTRVATFEQRQRQRQRAFRTQFGLAWTVLFAIIAVLVTVAVAKHRAITKVKLRMVATAIHEEIASPLVSALLHPVTPTSDPFLQSLFDEL